jgi:hypothetical protein
MGGPQPKPKPKKPKHKKNKIDKLEKAMLWVLPPRVPNLCWFWLPPMGS